MKVVCHNCNHEFEVELREAFEMVKCPMCKGVQLVQALGRQVQSKTEDPRVVKQKGNRVVSPL